MCIEWLVILHEIVNNCWSIIYKGLTLNQRIQLIFNTGYVISERSNLREGKSLKLWELCRTLGGKTLKMWELHVNPWPDNSFKCSTKHFCKPNMATFLFTCPIQSSILLMFFTVHKNFYFSQYRQLIFD